MPNTEPEAADLHAGAKLRMQRQLRGLSQTAVADALGVTFQQIQKYEKGSNRISASKLQAISKLLGVPVSFFFDHDDDGHERKLSSSEAGVSSEISKFIAMKEAIQLTRAYMTIKQPDRRKAVLAIIEAIASAVDPT